MDKVMNQLLYEKRHITLYKCNMGGIGLPVNYLCEY